MHKNTEPSIHNLPSSASTKTTRDQLHQLLCFSRTLAAQTIILTMSDITVAPKKTPNTTVIQKLYDVKYSAGNTTDCKNRSCQDWVRNVFIFCYEFAVGPNRWEMIVARLQILNFLKSFVVQGNFQFLTWSKDNIAWAKFLGEGSSVNHVWFVNLIHLCRHLCLCYTEVLEILGLDVHTCIFLLVSQVLM